MKPEKKQISKFIQGFLVLACLLPLLVSAQKYVAEPIIPGNSPVHISTLQLKSGLTVIMSEDPTRPQIMGGIAVKVGSKHDPADHTGIAHYLEHMLFKGTTRMGTVDYSKEEPFLKEIYALYEQLGKESNSENRKEIQKKINENSLKAGEFAILNEMDNLLRSIGSTGINAFTSDEITFYFNQFPPNQFEKWAELYSHRFMEPVFRAFQSELEVVYEEKNMYMDNFVTGLFEAFMANLYKKHPYGQQTTLGSVEHLKNPSLNRMYEFYNTYYVANNMALILVGDFKAKDLQAVIEDKFGRIKTGAIPEFPVCKEQAFKGREIVKVRMSPIKVGILGFRTVPNNHPDQLALDVANRLLSNNGQTGLLDQLNSDNKLMMCGLLPFPSNNDYGHSIILYIPKIIGQSHNKAEKLVIGQLDKLKKGNFDDKLFEAVKNDLYLEYITSLEDFSDRAVLLAQAFTQNKSMSDFLLYPDMIRRVSKEDVIRVANTYYGDNYLSFRSSMGSSKKEKLEKPGFEPITPASGVKSEFAREFERIPSLPAQPSFVVFDKDVQTIDLGNHTQLYLVKNPVNSVFSLTLRFGALERDFRLLKYAANMMNYASVKGKSLDELKKEFQILGCNYSFSSNENYFVVELQGIENSFKQSVALLYELISDPQLEQSRLKLLVEQEKAERKMENVDPASVGTALLQFVRKGERSAFLDRLSMKEIQKLKAFDLIAEVKEAMQGQLEIHLVSSDFNPVDFQEVFKPFSSMTQRSFRNIPCVEPPLAYEENTVFFVHKKDAVQSQIYFYVATNEYITEQEAMIDAFNEYFGGGFSGLVTQEIREYRSMAYSAGARYVIPPMYGVPAYLMGYIGTQADKTYEAIDVFLGLLKEMPVKEDRLDVLRASLVQEALGARPFFRDMSKTVISWKNRGFEKDPNDMKMVTFTSFTFDNLMEFYTSNLLYRPVVVCVVGDQNRISTEELKKYGALKVINEADLYKK